MPALLRPLLLSVALILAGLPAPGQTRLDLRDVDLRTFVQLVAEQTQRNFLLDPGVTGTVTVFAPMPVSPEALYEIFLNVLELNALTIVEGAEIDRIVPAAAARSLSPGTRTTGRGGEFQTRVLAVAAADMSEVVNVIQPLLAPEATLTPIPSQGLMVVSDRRENLDRIEALVNRLSTASDRGVEAIPLAHANAAELLPVLQSVAAAPAGASLAADARANTIVVAGPAEFRNRIRGVIGRLDLPQTRTVSRVVNLNYADARELAEVVRASVAGGGDPGAITVVAEPRANAILVTAPADRADSIVQAIRALDTRPSQVLIEAVIFEISAENFADLSVQFGGLLSSAIGAGTSFQLDGRLSLVQLIAAARAGVIPNPGAGGTLLASDGQGFAALVTAIARERTTRLLSTPAVLTLNNQEAEIVVAQNVPFVTGRFATVGDSAVPERPFQTIERQDVGLTLRVRPQITQDGTVRLAIAQEVSNLTGTTAAAGGEVTARRRLATHALVGDGQVIILGGLIEDSSRTTNERVPGLSSLPVLGQLFRGRAVQEGQRVLLVMLRPRVVRDDREATRLTRELARESERLAREAAPRNDALFPQVRRTGLPFDGVDLNQPFDTTYVDRAVRERLFPALPPRLPIDQGH
jgi:general secretion pathway protein D